MRLAPLAVKDDAKNDHPGKECQANQSTHKEERSKSVPTKPHPVPRPEATKPSATKPPVDKMAPVKGHLHGKLDHAAVRHAVTVVIYQLYLLLVVRFPGLAPRHHPKSPSLLMNPAPEKHGSSDG